MEIPDYIIKGALAHMERVAAYCKADRDDTRTANALRLLRRDISNIRRRMTANADNANAEAKTIIN